MKIDPYYQQQKGQKCSPMTLVSGNVRRMACGYSHGGSHQIIIIIIIILFVCAKKDFSGAGGQD